jgi:SARP family transcriptional regulator, regulator of embCAB operon
MAASAAGVVRVELLGEFRLSHGRDTVAMAHGSQHLLAFVAIHRHAVERPVVAGTLWPDAPDRRANATLRSALTRLDTACRDALHVDNGFLRLADGVAVDVHEARALALRVLDPAIACPESDLSAKAVAVLALDLLPGWYDDWAILQSEDWRQLRLHALEAVASKLTAVARYGEAVAAAFASVHADPLRESAQAVLIGAHLAEGNRADALRQFEQFRSVLKAELGLEPTAHLRDLVHNRH